MRGCFVEMAANVKAGLFDFVYILFLSIYVHIIISFKVMHTFVSIVISLDTSLNLLDASGILYYIP